MKAYATSATVEQRGEVRLAGVPFAPGTEVEVTISPKRRSVKEFSDAWQRITAELRRASGPQALSDEHIQKEIDDYRSGR